MSSPPSRLIWDLNLCFSMSSLLFRKAGKVSKKKGSSAVISCPCSGCSQVMWPKNFFHSFLFVPQTLLVVALLFLSYGKQLSMHRCVSVQQLLWLVLYSFTQLIFPTGYSPFFVDRFQMTSRRPYWCTKQWNGGHVGVQKKSSLDWTLF